IELSDRVFQRIRPRLVIVPGTPHTGTEREVTAGVRPKERVPTRGERKRVVTRQIFAKRSLDLAEQFAPRVWRPLFEIASGADPRRVSFEIPFHLVQIVLHLYGLDQPVQHTTSR